MKLWNIVQNSSVRDQWIINQIYWDWKFLTDEIPKYKEIIQKLSNHMI